MDRHLGKHACMQQLTVVVREQGLHILAQLDVARGLDQIGYGSRDGGEHWQRTTILVMTGMARGHGYSYAGGFSSGTPAANPTLAAIGFWTCARQVSPIGTTPCPMSASQLTL